MKPKEKAEYLINKFIRNARHFEEGNMFAENSENAKRCALICVYEIGKSWSEDGNTGLDVGVLNWWYEVKQEIEKL